MKPTFHFADGAKKGVGTRLVEIVAIVGQQEYTHTVPSGWLVPLPVAIRGRITVDPVTAGVFIRRRF